MIETDERVRMLTRRTFVRTGTLAATGWAALADRLLAAPYDPLPKHPGIAPTVASPVRIQGIVRAGGRGLGASPSRMDSRSWTRTSRAASRW